MEKLFKINLCLVLVIFIAGCPKKVPETEASQVEYGEFDWAEADDLELWDDEELESLPEATTVGEEDEEK
jgi:PBP1b-binding outer membrane lipoprotein LpoB